MVLIEILKTEKHKKKNGNVFTIQKSFFSEIIFSWHFKLQIYIFGNVQPVTRYLSVHPGGGVYNPSWSSGYLTDITIAGRRGRAIKAGQDVSQMLCAAICWFVCLCNSNGRTERNNRPKVFVQKPKIKRRNIN